MSGVLQFEFCFLILADVGLQVPVMNVRPQAVKTKENSQAKLDLLSCMCYL